MANVIAYQPPDSVADLLPATWYEPGPVPRRHRLLGFAALAIAVGASLAAPVAGAITVTAGVTVLRAAGRVSHAAHHAVRRAARHGRANAPGSGPVTRRRDDATVPSWLLAEAPTIPLRAVASWGGEDLRGPRQAEPGAAGYGAAGLRLHRFRWIKRFTGTVIALIAVGAIAFTGLMLGLPGVGDAPGLAQALDRTHHATYYRAPLPPQVAAALVATEDHRFYSEPGTDPAAAGRMILGRLGGPDQGGSTLYQQLARMLYVPGRSGLLAEAEQVLLGIKLDLNFSKAQILQMYAGIAYFGHGYYGLAAASCGYFAEQPTALSWGQAAMLAGLVQAPSADDPFGHYANARAREAHVLIRLIETGTLTRQQASQAYQSPLHLARGGTGGCAA